MGTIDCDSPDFLPLPTIFAEAARLTRDPRLLAWLLLACLTAAELEHEKQQPHTHDREAFVFAPASPSAVTVQTTDVTVRLTGVSATGSVGRVTGNGLPPTELPPFEPPHTHEEREDP